MSPHFLKVPPYSTELFAGMAYYVLKLLNSDHTSQLGISEATAERILVIFIPYSTQTLMQITIRVYWTKQQKELSGLIKQLNLTKT